MQNSNPMISIIMPVYGVEDYVARAIESIQAQTFSNYEFLIVDDGTKDRSGEICDEYAKKDDRISVFHKQNGGAPSARNYAMDRARGKYYYFLDSDDWVEADMLEKMLALAEENEAELVISSYYIDTYRSETDFYRETKEWKSRSYPNQEDFRKDAVHLFDNNLLYTPWNKLFLREYIESKKIRFHSVWMDDFPFNLDVIRDVERVVVTNEKFYHFIRARAESETSKYRPDMYEKREEEDGWMRELYSYWGIQDSEVEEFLSRRYVERLVGCVENITTENCTLSKEEKIAEIKRIITTPRAKESSRRAKPNSRYMQMLIRPIQTGRPRQMYCYGKAISYVKKHFVKVFSALKANR